VLGIGGRFRYVHQLEDPHDRVAILEFATEVDGKQVEGIDKLPFDEDGLITELKVMIRPASALQLVGAKMAEEFPRVGLGFPSCSFDPLVTWWGELSSVALGELGCARRRQRLRPRRRRCPDVTRPRHRWPSREAGDRVMTRPLRARNASGRTSFNPARSSAAVHAHRSVSF